MNKIYKVVWSKVRNCYVVASELAKRRTKGSGARGLHRAAVTLGVTAALVGGISGNAWAALSEKDKNQITTELIIVGTSGDAAKIVTTDNAATLLLSTLSGYTLNNNAAITAGTISGSTTISTTGSITGSTITASTLMIGSVNVGDSITALQTTVNSKADSATVTAIDTRVTTAEGKITTLETTVGNTETGLVKDVADNKSDITTLQTTVGDANSGLVKDVALKANSTGATLENVTINNGTIKNAVTIGDAGTKTIENVVSTINNTQYINTTDTSGQNRQVTAITSEYFIAANNQFQIRPGGAVYISGGNLFVDTDGSIKLGNEPVFEVKNKEIKTLEFNGSINGTATFNGSGPNKVTLKNGAITATGGITGNTITATDALKIGTGESVIDVGAAVGGAGVIDASTVEHANELVKGSTVYDYLNGATLALGANSTNIAIGKGNSIPNPVTGIRNTVIGYNNTITDIAGASPSDPPTATSTNLNVFGQNNKITGSSDSIFIGNKIYTNDGTESGAPVSNANHDVFLGNNIHVGANVDHSIGIGENTQVRDSYAIAIGSGGSSYGTTTSSQFAIAIGHDTEASGRNAIAIGSGYTSNGERGAKATAVDTIAIGNTAIAKQERAIAIGYNAQAGNADQALWATALGASAQANANFATALGASAHANANFATAIGYDAYAKSNGTTALGSSTDATGQYAVAIGQYAKTNGTYSIAIGGGNRSESSVEAATAIGEGSIAIGKSASTTAEQATAVGMNTNAVANGTAIGYNARANKNASTAIGYGANATENGENATAIGYSSSATGHTSIAIAGTASASLAIAIGRSTTATGERAIGIGVETTASGVKSIAIGSNSSASLADSVALGSGAVTTRAAYDANTNPYTAYLGDDNDDTKTNSTWRSTHGAVSVGNDTSGSEVTRQITGVAAGSADTDAVNVAQLKSATPMINDQHKYYNGSESAVSVVDAVNAVDKALGIIPSPTSGNYNYLSVYDATNEAGTFAKNLIALDRAIGSMSGFGNQHYAQDTGSVAANLTALDTQVYINATDIGTLKTKTQNISATATIAGTTTMEGILNVVPSGETTGIAINGTAQTITGLSNKTWDASSIASGRAATEDQLKSATSSLSTTLTDTGLNFGANNVTAALTNKLGSTVNIMGTVAQDGHTYSAANVTTEIVQDTSGNSTITVKLDESPSFTNITATGTATFGSGTNTVTISGGAITATGNISGKDITASGQLSSKTFVVDGVDVTTPLKTAGVVANGNTGAGFVTGATVYSEVRPTSDGTYVKTANTTATNLTALDTQLKANTDSIAALQSSTTAAVGTIDADGNYIKKSDTNNVSQNLVALDTAIGDMSEFGSNNYAKSTASVATNIKSLDTQVKTNTDDITTLKNSISVKEDASGVKTTTIDGNLVIKEQDGTTKDVTTALTTEGEVAKQGDAGSEGYLKGETVYDYLNKGENGKEVKLAKESKQIAVGQGSVASGVESIAIGNETGGQRNEATGLQSIAIGFGNQVTGAHSGAIGDPTYIAADNSYAMGNSNNITATGARSFAIGNNNTISGSDTFVLGSNVNTNASNAVVLGNNSVGEDGAVSVGSVGNERQIKHVAPGTDANDAATVGQVAALAQNTTTVINRVDSKLNKVGAGAAALAALHPLDTDDKFTMGMGYGNYRNSHAAAIGMFYRPTDKVMISMSGTMGNGENMFNAGISFALDKGKGFSTSKAAMARKIAAQEEKISEQDAKIQSLAAENAKLAERLAAIEAKLSK